MLNWFRKPGAPEYAAVPARIAEDERIYAVGDVHGRDELLRAMLVRITEDAARFDDGRFPHIVFLGDYVDRGDHSREVLDLLTRLADLPTARTTFLRGNHEAAMLRFVDDPVGRKEWLSWGGIQTLGSYGLPPPAKPYDEAALEALGHELHRALGPHMAFLEATRTIARSGDYVFAHAGIDPSRPADAQEERALLWGHPDFLDRAPSETPLRVVHGHYDTAEAELLPHRINVDTGAYYSGRLTAVRLDAGPPELIAVDVFDTPM